MEKNKCRLVTEERKILKGVKRVRKELNSELENYLHLMMDIDDGLDTLYEHDAMTDAELMEFIERTWPRSNLRKNIQKKSIKKLYHF